jgi:RecA/RadA recombinase
MSSRPFDISKFRKQLTKSIEGLGIGFNDPTDWISTGNYALNYLISGDFYKGVPLGKCTLFAGESGCLPKSASVRVKHESGEVEDITVNELRYIWKNILIETPDGFQKITNWFNKGFLPMVEVTTESGLVTRCATNHLLQTTSDGWISAEFALNNTVITINSVKDAVVSVVNKSPDECFDFTIDHESHRYWGDGFSSHNSGKSYICSGNVIKNAQQQGIFPILIDTENALDEKWLQDLGVDTSEDKLLKLSMAMVDDVAKTISEFMKNYKEMPAESRPKVIIIIDSLGMLLVSSEILQFQEGSLRGDLGRKPKALTALVRNLINLISNEFVGILATNHTYASQDPYNPDQIISGGQGFIYASSIVVAMKKLKLKEDDEGNKTTTVNGIRAGCMVTKSRYSKPFQKIEVQIPYDTGMSPTSGLFELFEEKKLISKEGNRYTYTDLKGNIHKYFRKEWNKNENGILDLVMNEYQEKEKLIDKKIVQQDKISDNEDTENGQ